MEVEVIKSAESVALDQVRKLLVSDRALAASGCVANAQFGQLAVEWRAADPEAAGDFGHPAPVMADGEADHVGFDSVSGWRSPPSACCARW